MNTATTLSVDPSTPTSTTASNSTTGPPPPQPLYPGELPTFTTVDSFVYANVTIDDFSPLVSYSNFQLGGDWISPLTDSDMSAARPVAQRNWHLGTYRRAERLNATLTIDFWGSAIYIFGDRGPAYGSYLLQVDDQEPVTRSAHYPALAIGPAHFVDSVTNLTEGRHTLTITNRGGRPGFIEGDSFLFDYALVTQRVGPVPGRGNPGVTDVQGTDLAKLSTSGTWSLSTLNRTVFSTAGEDTKQPNSFYQTTEANAAVVYPFANATAIFVYGNRNASHGLYRATLTSGRAFNTNTTFNASAPCGFPGDTQNIYPSCEWQGSVLKYAVSGLDPSLAYNLTLENLGNTTLDVSLIRTFDAIGTALEPGGGREPGPSGSGAITNGVLGSNLVLFVMAWCFLWKGFL